MTEILGIDFSERRSKLLAIGIVVVVVWVIAVTACLFDYSAKRGRLETELRKKLDDAWTYARNKKEACKAGTNAQTYRFHELQGKNGSTIGQGDFIAYFKGGIKEETFISVTLQLRNQSDCFLDSGTLGFDITFMDNKNTKALMFLAQWSVINTYYFREAFVGVKELDNTTWHTDPLSNSGIFLHLGQTYTIDFYFGKVLKINVNCEHYLTLKMRDKTDKVLTTDTDIVSYLNTLHTFEVRTTAGDKDTYFANILDYKIHY